MVEISPALTKHKQVEIGIVSSYSTKGILGEVVAAQTINTIFFGKPEFFSPYSPERESISSITDFCAGEETNTVLLSALNNIKELPLSRNHMFLILCSANLISAAAKFPEYRRLLPLNSLKCLIREFVSRCIRNYDTVSHFMEQLYVENCGECVYIRSYGLQFSFMNIGADEIIYGYATSDKNAESPWDGVRLQPIAYALYKLALESFENDYDSTKVNAELSSLINPSTSASPVPTERGPLGSRNSEISKGFKLEQVRDHFSVGDFVYLNTTDNLWHKGVIDQIDEHSIVLSNGNASRFFFEGYILSMQHFAPNIESIAEGSGFEEFENIVSKFVKSRIEQENKRYPLADSVLRFLAERQLGVEVSIKDITYAREALGYPHYKERQEAQDIKQDVKQDVRINHNDNIKYLSFGELGQFCEDVSSFWNTTRQGFHKRIYIFTKANGGFANKQGKAYSFKSQDYTVFVNEFYFARNISNARKHPVWYNQFKSYNKKSRISYVSAAIETGSLNELKQSYCFYFSRASFGACSAISDYLETCGVDVKPLRTQVNKVRQLFSNNSKLLSRKYPGNDIKANALEDRDKSIVKDFLYQMLSCNAEEPFTMSEIWNVLFVAFDIRFSKENIGGLCNFSLGIDRNVYWLRVSNMSSINDTVNEIMHLASKLLEINGVSEDAPLPTNAKITHFNGTTYTIQDEFTCETYCVSRKLMVGKPSMGYVFIVTAQNGKLLSATNLATYGEVLSFFRIALQEGPYHEFMQTFKLLIRSFEVKEDISGKMKLNMKRLLKLRGLKEEEYEDISFYDLDDGDRSLLVAYVKFILESKDGFKMRNEDIRYLFEETNNINVAIKSIKEAKNIVFETNPDLSNAYRRYLIEHRDK